MTTAEYPLPAQQNSGAARKAEGFVTPRQDKKPQCARVLPKRVLPIIFLPGIMGSNLRMSAKRQKELEQKDNIAWRPDSLGPSNAGKNVNSSARERQLRLDPLETTVDIYDPTGPTDITGDERNAQVKLAWNFHSPSLTDDLGPPKLSASQKARLRGWGEVYFDSYGEVLQHLEARLNGTFTNGTLRQEWRDVIGVDPKHWLSDPRIPQQPLTEEELKKVSTGRWFPVYALGYNWLQSNGDSAKIIAARINQIIEGFKKFGYECDKVIVVTHSMGGLVGRALVHPDYGNMQEKILGVVHGAMPAIGAPAAYRRMRAGFEDPGWLHPLGSIAARIAGNFGDEVTAVLANAPGGLQLLPTESYGNGWLRVTHQGRDLGAFPKNGDPYGEIYKLRHNWYGLFREEWINPSHALARDGGGTFERTCKYLNRAQRFHEQIAATFHPNTYAHYGADADRLSFGEVVWEIDERCADTTGWQDWKISKDDRQGELELSSHSLHTDGKSGRARSPAPSGKAGRQGAIRAKIQPPTAPGDQTVPIQSSDYQVKRGALKAAFRQTGYEHQSSFKDPRAVASTLYSIVRIAQNAE